MDKKTHVSVTRAYKKGSHGCYCLDNYPILGFYAMEKIP